MTDNSIPAPPPGFQLQDSGNVPSPPPGFQLQQAQQPHSAPANQQALSNAFWKAHGDGNDEAAKALFHQILAEGGKLQGPSGDAAASVDKGVSKLPDLDPNGSMQHGTALFARDVTKGVLGVPALVHDALVRPVVNGVAKMVGSDYRAAPAMQTIDNTLTSAGVPQAVPQNAAEQYGGQAVQAAANVAPFVGAGQYLERAAQPVVSAVGRDLAGKIGGQVASSVAGAESAQAAKDAGAPAWGQFLAGTVGGLAPASIKYGAEKGIQSAFNGGESGRQAAEQNIPAFKAVGTTPTAYQATGGKLSGWLEGVTSKLPGGSPIRDFANKQAQQTASGIDEISGRLSPVTDPVRAGRTIQRGISGPGGFVDRFKAEGNALYDSLDQHIAPSSRVEVNNTLKTLSELNPTIPGAPNVSKYFQNGRIQGIEGALNQDVRGVDSALSRPEVAQKAQSLRERLQANDQAVNQYNAAEQARVSQDNLASLGAVKQKFEPAQPLGQSGIEQQIRSLASQQVDGKLPYDALKKLRTLVGDEVSNFSLTSDVPRSKWKALYGAISQDMKQAANDAGPGARRAFNRANAYYHAGSSRLDAISHVVDKNGGPESVFNAAMSGTRDGATTLRAVMQSLKPDEQKVLASVVLRRLGKATPGTQNAEGDAFSMSTFLTNWNRLSPQAKSTLFGRFGPDYADIMDKMARVAERVKSGSKVLANPSGSATTGANIAAWATFLSSLAHGDIGTASLVGGGAASNNLLARLITNPTFVKFLGKQIKMGLPPQAANLTHLVNASKVKKDADLMSAAHAIQSMPRQQ